LQSSVSYASVRVCICVCARTFSCYRCFYRIFPDSLEFTGPANLLQDARGRSSVPSPDRVLGRPPELSDDTPGLVATKVTPGHLRESYEPPNLTPSKHLLTSLNLLHPVTIFDCSNLSQNMSFVVAPHAFQAIARVFRSCFPQTCSGPEFTRTQRTTIPTLDNS